MKESRFALELIDPNPDNPRTIKDAQYRKAMRSVAQFPQMLAVRGLAIVRQENGRAVVLGGNQRRSVLKDLQKKHGKKAAFLTEFETTGEAWEVLDDYYRNGVPFHDCTDMTEEQRRRFVIADNVDFGEWDAGALANWDSGDLEAWGVDVFDDANDGENGQPPNNDAAYSRLQERFICPPFSVLDAKQGYWQDRKREWLALGIESEVGRGGELAYNMPVNVIQRLIKMKNEDVKTAWQGGGTSIFDPVLCELCYRWFNVKNGLVLDPFAGGSVRGIVAGMLECEYTGIELRQEQVDANIGQEHIVERAGKPAPKWICYDSAKMDDVLPDGEAFDMVFTCPPYGDLEVYSDNPADISNMSNDEFLSAYRNIIDATYRHLKQDRFAVFVVGDYRLKDGSMANFVSSTIRFAIDAGYKLYNEMILLTALGSLPIRAGRQFQASRKVGKTHQNILVFYKGDAKKVKSIFGEIVVQGVEVDGIGEHQKTVAKQS